MQRRCLEAACAQGLVSWDLAAELWRKYKFVAYLPVHDYVASLKEVAGKAAGRRNKV
jgi:hypothetical protein